MFCIKWCWRSNSFLHFGISYFVYFAPPTDMETRLQSTYLRQTLKLKNNKTTISRIWYWFDSIEISKKKRGLSLWDLLREVNQEISKVIGTLKNTKTRYWFIDFVLENNKTKSSLFIGWGRKRSNLKLCKIIFILTFILFVFLAFFFCRIFAYFILLVP